MTISNTAIAVFLFNRPKKAINILSQLLEISRIIKIPVYIFVDGSRGPDEKHLVNDVQKSVLEYSENIELKYYFSVCNKGLANSIINGVSFVLENFDSVIVFEDDLIFDSNCIEYFLDGLNQYEGNDEVFSLSGHSNPINKNTEKIKEEYFLCRRPTTWGWATWANRWFQVEWDKNNYNCLSKENILVMNTLGYDIKYWLSGYMRGEVDSWGIRWTIHHILKDKYAVVPKNSYIINDGFGPDSTNTKSIRNKSFSVTTISNYIKIPKQLFYKEEVEQLYVKKYINYRFLLYVKIRETSLYKFLKKTILKIAL